MITQETLEKIAQRFQTGVFPNVVREYFQHVFLMELYKVPEAGQLLFKGGTALRIIYGSPRFSEDLDYSLIGVSSDRVKKFVEDLFIKVLEKIEQAGIRVELGEKSNVTSGGYFGVAELHMLDYPPVGVELNISSRDGRSAKGEVDSVVGDFVTPYSVVHLAQTLLVEEKVFGALLERKKPRDFYDLYFMLRKNMLSADQKKRLAKVQDQVTTAARAINFRGELSAFLPADQQSLIRDFLRALVAEISRQVA